MLLIIAFRKIFKNVMLICFFEFFGYEHKFETGLEKLLEHFFLR